MFVCVVTTDVTHIRPFGALQCDNRGLSALQARFNSQTALPVLLLSELLETGMTSGENFTITLVFYLFKLIFGFV